MKTTDENTRVSTDYRTGSSTKSLSEADITVTHDLARDTKPGRVNLGKQNKQNFQNN